MAMFKLRENSLNDLNNIQETVFLNRGIKDYKNYCKVTSNNIDSDDVLFSNKLLSNIETATNLFSKYLRENKHFHIVVDCDTDGYTSASILYRYISSVLDEGHITYSIHTEKQHGLTPDIINNILDNKDIDMLLIPDAGSEDWSVCKQVKQHFKEKYDKELPIIILDHHETSSERLISEHAVIVNNTLNDYPNKHLSGVGVVYKFLQCVDAVMWDKLFYDYSYDYLDIVALGMIGDNMDIKSDETRYLIHKGLNRIHSKMFSALIASQDKVEKIDVISVLFYIVPIINAVIRVGTQEEKDLLFRGLCECKDIDEPKNIQRRISGSNETTYNTMYDYISAICKKCKTNQSTIWKKILPDIHKSIKKYRFDDNKILFIPVGNEIPATITGVLAAQLATEYNKPTLLLRKHNANKQNDEPYYTGSGRNISDSTFSNFKDFLNGLNIFDFVAGHQEAFGFRIKSKEVKNAITKANEQLKDTVFENCIKCDFVVDDNEISVGDIKTLDDLSEYYGSGFETCEIAIQNITVDESLFKIMGKTNNVWKFTDENNITFVNFQLKKNDEMLRLIVEENATFVNIDVVGRANINNYRGLLTPQIIIDDYVVNSYS